jgi:hypothetical protein
MHALGITEAKNSIRIFNPEAEFPQPEYFTTPIFTEDKSTGDIEILYYTINGELIPYLQMSDAKTSSLNAKQRYYKTRRLKEPHGDMKYQMPSGQNTRPWFHPVLVEKFKAAERIETLFLTEGVFKAWRGCEDGMMVVGLPSVTCYKDPDGRLYEDVRNLIEVCRVDNVVVLWDGDCLNISAKDLTAMEDLTNRPYMFFNSAKRIAELVRKIEFKKTRSKPAVWFMHIKSDCYPERPKGLDDLLIEAAKKDKTAVGRVVHEAHNILGDTNFFFFKKNLSDSPAPLHKYFGLHSADVFYNRHIDRIGSKEWKFRKSTYKWNDDKNELEEIAPEWADRLKWVGDEFFLEEVVPGAIRARKTLLHYDSTTCKRLFGSTFVEKLTHFRAFCNVPDHFNYNQVIESEGARYYNRYFPFPHVEQEGNWSNILAFFKHIFGDYEVTHGGDENKKYRSYELGLDYVQILLTRPTQILPVLCLFSRENNTGKSTFGKLLMYLFGDNSIQIGNQDLQSDFNEQYADKLLAICEETLLERKRDAERIKALSTSDQVSVNPKGQKQYTIDFFCKFIFMSNNVRMIYVNKHDQRFWIVQVPTLKSDDPNFLEKMKAEMPAFIHFLRRRKLATERESRMHFHYTLLRTPVFEEVVRVNEPHQATDMREQIREMFLQLQDEHPEMQEFRMTLKEVKEEFFSGGKASDSWVQEILKDYMNVDLARDERGNAIFERGKYIRYEAKQNPDGTKEIIKVEKPYRGRPYVFKRAQFVGDLAVSFKTEVLPDASGGVQATSPDWKTAAANDQAGEQETLPF